MRKRTITTVLIIGLFFVSTLTFAEASPASPKKVSALPAEIKIGGVFPITVRPDAGPDRRDGFLIAIAEINNQTGLDRILPVGVNLTYNVQDDLNTAAGGTTAAQNLLSWGADVVIGSSGSSVSAAMASELTSTKVVQVSYASSSPALSDRTLYPYFMRVCASDADQGIAIAKLVKAFNWTQGAVIHTSDSYGTGLIEIFKSNYNDTGTVLTDQSFEAGATDVSAQVQALKDVDPDFIVGNFIDEDAKTVMKKAADLDMLDYVWITTDGWSTTATITDADVKAAMNNSIGTNPAPSSGTGLQDFNSTWFNTTFSYLAGPANSQATGQAFNSYAPFAYDAVYVVAKGLAAANDIDGDLLLAALYDVEHDGATGHIEFNSLGEVIGRYDYVQLRGDTFVSFGEYSIPSGQTVATAVLGNDANFVLADGSEWTIASNVVTNTKKGSHGGTAPGFEILIGIFGMGILVITLKKRRN